MMTDGWNSFLVLFFKFEKYTHWLGTESIHAVDRIMNIVGIVSSQSSGQ